MIMVDSSVWIDYFSGIETPQAQRLDVALGSHPIVIGDLILTEVLQGFRRDRDYGIAKSLFEDLLVLPLLGREMALRSAENFRALRKHGITVRKTADVIIATFCIARELPLLYSDRDFDPFVERLGLIRV